MWKSVIFSPLNMQAITQKKRANSATPGVGAVVKSARGN